MQKRLPQHKINLNKVVTVTSLTFLVDFLFEWIIANHTAVPVLNSDLTAIQSLINEQKAASTIAKTIFYKQTENSQYHSEDNIL